MVNPLRKTNHETGASISRKSQESVNVKIRENQSKKKGRCCGLFETRKREKIRNTESVKNANELTEDEEREKRVRFPCCFHIPLEIVMGGLAVFDIILYTLIALITTFIAILESFTARQLTEEETRPIGMKSYFAFKEMMNENMTDPNYDYDEYDEMFAETSTTLGPLLFNPEVDIKHLAETYSRVAKTWLLYVNNTYAKCGKTYYKDFLLTHQMNITKELFEEVTRTIIISCSAYIIIASVLLSCLCCFRGYLLSKAIVILLCYAQLFPSYAIYSIVLIKSQNRRLCIMEHGLGPTFKAQSGLFWILGIPLFFYKPYEIFIWCVYIKRYFQNKEGALQDESYFSPARVERRKRVSTRKTSSAGDHHHHARIQDKYSRGATHPTTGREPLR